VFGIALGVVLNEPITLNRIAGTALIIAGVALVNSRYGARPIFGSHTAPDAAPGGAAGHATPAPGPSPAPATERR
jgi:drug/metabolite transporter (DMT)-like permease